MVGVIVIYEDIGSKYRGASYTGGHHGIQVSG